MRSRLSSMSFLQVLYMIDLYNVEKCTGPFRWLQTNILEEKIHLPHNTGQQEYSWSGCLYKTHIHAEQASHHLKPTPSRDLRQKWWSNKMTRLSWVVPITFQAGVSYNCYQCVCRKNLTGSSIHRSEKFVGFPWLDQMAWFEYYYKMRLWQ